MPRDLNEPELSELDSDLSDFDSQASMAEAEMDVMEDSDEEEMPGLMRPNDYAFKGTITADNPLPIPMESPFYLIKLTSVSFGESVKKGSRTVIQVQTEEDETHVLAVLNEGNQESFQCDYLVSTNTILTVAGTKPSKVYVTGYFSPISTHVITDEMAPMPGMLDDEEDDELELDEEEEADLERQIQEKMSQRGKKKRSRQAMADSDEEPASQANEAKQEENKEVEAPPRKRSKGQWMKVGGGLELKDVKSGTGRTAKKGDTAVVYYVGQLENKKVFDKCISGEGFSFTIGQGEVIKGWDLGVAGMKVGTKRRLVIPAKLAYGPAGSPPEIPPNSKLNFTVELKALK